MSDSNTIIIKAVLDSNTLAGADIVQYLAEPIALGANELFQIAIKRVQFSSCAFVEKNVKVGEVTIHYPPEADAVIGDAWQIPMRVSYMDGLSCLQAITNNLPPDVRYSTSVGKQHDLLSLEVRDGIRLDLPYDIGKKMLVTVF